MLIINTQVIFLLLLLPSMILSYATSAIYSLPHMDTQCGKTILLNGDSFPGTHFSLTSGNYKSNLDCTLTIKAATKNQRIIVVIDKMHIECGGDKLLIYDGKKDQDLLLNNNHLIQCGTKKYYLKTEYSNTVIIHFISNNDGKVGNGFIMNVAINFPVSSCSKNENLYRCKNHYCISYVFNCDTRNWCGDNSQDLTCR